MRRSIYPASFIEGNLTKEIVIALLDAANLAPTHRLTQPWRFKVFMKDRLDCFSEGVKNAFIATSGENYSELKLEKTLSKISKSSAMLAISMERDTEERVPEWEEIASMAMAVQNLWTSLEDYGLGGYWSTPAYAMSQYFAEFLQLGENEKCYGLFYIGFVSPDFEAGEQIRSTIKDKIKWG
jgi:nitroreductase